MDDVNGFNGTWEYWSAGLMGLVHSITPHHSPTPPLHHSIVLLAASRFPPPEFSETGHQLPGFQAPPVRALFFERLDIAVLVLALALAAWLAFRQRSRRGLVWLGVFSMLYFGFWRKGCICSIGSIQNIALALGDSAYAIPVTAIAFGLLPLVVALFFGRVFCAAVCPHGAIQDVMLLKPVTVPTWLEHALRMLAYIYLGLAVVFAATGSGFIICEYDPFVPIFRLSGSTAMLVTGGVFLVASLFIGRPYCRFLCPYGVLLGLASRVSKWRIKVTPTTCTQCRLCEQACPFNALNPATISPPTRNLATAKRRLVGLFVLLPILAATGFWLGGLSGTALARKHRTVSLAERIQLEATGSVAGTTDAATVFRSTGTPPEELFAAAHQVQHRLTRAGRLVGLWIGLVIGLKLLALALRRPHPDYEADTTRCVACARCYRSCPEELKRLGLPFSEGHASAWPLPAVGRAEARPSVL